MPRHPEFRDIRIIGIDLERSHKPDPSLDLYDMYLELSEAPPEEWQRAFDAERSFPRHTMWRHARVEGKYIVVHCVPEELERYHLRDLKQDVDNSNAKYRQYLGELAQKEAERQRREAAEHSRLSELADRLDFDR